MTGFGQRPRNARGNVRVVGKRNRGTVQPVPRRRGRRFWVLVVIGALVVLAGVGELAAKSLLEQRITAAARDVLSGPLQVSIGGTPAIVDVARRRIPVVTVTAPSTTICGMTGVDASVRLAEVSRENGKVHTSGVDAAIVLDSASLAGVFSTLLGGATGRAAVLPDPAHDQLVVHAAGGIVKIAVAVELTGSTLSFRPVSASVAGRALPASILTELTSGKQSSRDLSNLPLGLKPVSVEVTATGLRVRFAAQATDLEQRPASPGTGCAV